MAIQDFTAGQVLTAAQMDSLQANDYNWTVSTKTASYVLTATDKGTRVVMNAAGATTITVNTSIFAAGDTLFIQNINSGTCTITAGTCTVNTAGSLALAQWQGGVLYFTSASTAIFFLAGSGASYGTGTGGSSSSITVSGINYTLLTFTSDGNLVVSKAGLFDVLLIGGGAGAGGATTNDASGGGGAGAIVGIGATPTTIYLAAATYAVDVGAGGNGGSSDKGGEGFESAIADLITAPGGGAGGSSSLNGVTPGIFGASGGGSPTSSKGLSVCEAFGNDGGSGVAAAAGGGGGHAAVGGNGSGTTGGSGGNGTDISPFITGATAYRAAGGGGGGTVTGGAAGNGGVAGKVAAPGNAATTAGSGGGGAASAAGSPAGIGGAGAAGVVYVRFKS